MRTIVAAATVCLLSLPASASVPSNDNMVSPTGIDVLPFVNAISTREATTTEADPYCAGRGPTVWYSFVAEEDGRIEVNTFGSNFDTTLSAYTVDSAGIRAITCNDDTDVLQSRLRLSVVAGVTYLFMVGSYGDGPGGDLVLTAMVAPPLPQLRLEQVASLRRPGIVTLRGSITCARPSTVYVSGEVVQPHRRGAADRRTPTWAQFPQSEVYCSGRTAWTSHPVPLIGSFEGGPAAVLANVWVCDPAGCDSYLLSNELTIASTRRVERYSAEEQGRGPRNRARPRRKN